jgi:hypothetical protein
MSFGNVKKAPAAPTQLEGAWMRGAWKFDLTGAPGSKKFEVDYLFFYKEGVACRQWNSEGQDGLDVAKEMAASDNRWGYWGRRTEKDGRVTISWTNGGETVYMHRDNNSLQEGSSAPYLALPSCDKLVLDGLYRYGDGKPMEFGGTNYEIRFTSDERFEESNLCSGTMRDGPKRGTGKYSIVNYTLHLEYEGGQKVRMGFYVVAQPESKMESVYLNTFVFSRAK